MSDIATCASKCLPVGRQIAPCTEPRGLAPCHVGLRAYNTDSVQQHSISLSAISHRAPHYPTDDATPWRKAEAAVFRDEACRSAHCALGAKPSTNIGWKSAGKACKSRNLSVFNKFISSQLWRSMDRDTHNTHDNSGVRWIMTYATPPTVSLRTTPTSRTLLQI